MSVTFLISIKYSLCFLWSKGLEILGRTRSTVGMWTHEFGLKLSWQPNVQKVCQLLDSILGLCVYSTQVLVGPAQTIY